LDVQVKDPGAGRVDSVGQEGIVWAGLKHGDAAVALAFGQRILIEQHFLVRFRLILSTTEDTILAAGLHAPVVGILTEGFGDAGVILLDASLHLLEELLLE
jgi:hypothetical protein